MSEAPTRDRPEKPDKRDPPVGLPKVSLFPTKSLFAKGPAPDEIFTNLFGRPPSPTNGRSGVTPNR
jgi:hypothetical protein